MGLNPEIWLPHFQFVMQTISILYPQYPNDATKKKYYSFINNMALFIPEKPLGNDYLKLLDEFPVTPYLSSRLSFMKWVHFINNKLLLRMNMPEVDFYDSLENYYNVYKPKELLHKEERKRRRQYIQIGVILAAVFLISYFSYRTRE